MSTQTERERKAMAAAGLLKPRTKSVQLRQLLPNIEEALEHNCSYEECMAYLVTRGLKYPNRAAFASALYEARKAGPLRTAFDGITSPPSAGNSSTAQERNEERSRNTSDGSSGTLPPVSVTRSVPVVRSTSFDQKTDIAHPKLKDFI